MFHWEVLPPPRPTSNSQTDRLEVGSKSQVLTGGGGAKLSHASPLPSRLHPCPNSARPFYFLPAAGTGWVRTKREDFFC